MPAASSESPPLGLPSMQTMLNESTHCISLATFSSAYELQDYLDGFSRAEKKARVNAEDEIGTTPPLARNQPGWTPRNLQGGWRWGATTGQQDTQCGQAACVCAM